MACELKKMWIALNFALQFLFAPYYYSTFSFWLEYKLKEAPKHNSKLVFTLSFDFLSFPSVSTFLLPRPQLSILNDCHCMSLIAFPFAWIQLNGGSRIIYLETWETIKTPWKIENNCLLNSLLPEWQRKASDEICKVQNSAWSRFTDKNVWFQFPYSWKGTFNEIYLHFLSGMETEIKCLKWSLRQRKYSNAIGISSTVSSMYLKPPIILI